ncbi:hypothetical protein V5O48_012433, partial [Marasmius crinis-equi]
MTPETTYTSIPPPLTLEDQLHVAYASDDIHLAKILLLKLKGIEVTSDSDPRIAAVRPEDFDECFIPAGGFMSEEDEEVIKEMQRVERERLQVELEQRQRREREETERRRRREWEMHCEKIWEGEKKRLREEKEFLERKREEERRRWEDTERRRKEVAERRITAASRYSTRSTVSTSKSKPRLSYASLSTERTASSSSSSMATDDDTYLYSFLPVPRVPPPPPRRRRGGASPPLSSNSTSSPNIHHGSASGTNSSSSILGPDSAVDDERVSRERRPLSSSPKLTDTSDASTFTNDQAPLESDSDSHTLACSSLSTAQVSFRDVLTSMRGPLFPLSTESESRPRYPRAGESSQSQSPIRHRTQSKGRCQDPVPPPPSHLSGHKNGVSSGHAIRRRRRDEELLSLLLLEVKWAEGERLMRGRPRGRAGIDGTKSQCSEKQHISEADSKEKERHLVPPPPARQNSTSSIKSCSSTTSSCAACSAVLNPPTSPTSSTSSAVSRPGSWLSSFSSSTTSTDITTPSTSLSTSPVKATLSHLQRHVSSSVPTSNVRSTVAGWLRKSAIAAASQQNQARELHSKHETHLVHSCHRSPFSRLTPIMIFDGPLSLDEDADGKSSSPLHDGGDEAGLRNDTTPGAADSNAGNGISLHGAASLARQMTRFVELAKGFQTAYINMTAFSALHAVTSYDGRSWDLGVDAEEEEHRRRRKMIASSAGTQAVARRRLRPVGYRVERADAEFFFMRTTSGGVRKDKEANMRGQETPTVTNHTSYSRLATNEGSAGILPDEEAAVECRAREQRSRSWYQDEEDGVEYIPLVSPHPPAYPPKTVLPSPLPYALFFKPSIPLVPSPHRRVSQQHNQGFEDGMEFGSLSASSSPYSSLARGTGRFSSRLSSSPPPRSSPRSKRNSRSNSHSPTRRSSLSRLQNPQNSPSPIARPRLVANPVYLRLRAVKNVGHELGVNWEPEHGKNWGPMSAGKEKVLTLAYDEIGRSVLGRENEQEQERDLANYRRGAGVGVGRVMGRGIPDDRRGRHDRPRISVNVVQVDGFTGVRRGRNNDEKWARIKAGLDLANFSPTQYLSLYTEAYNYCYSFPLLDPTYGKADTTNWITNWGRGSVDTPSSDLYTRIVDYFGPDRFKEAEVELLDNEDLLTYYSSNWTTYKYKADYANRIFNQLINCWVKKLRREGRQDLYPVYQLALLSWKEYFLSPLQRERKLTGALIQLTMRHYRGEVVDVDLLKNVLSSLVELGIDTEHMKLVSLDIYKEHLETDYLESRKNHYREVSETLAFQPQSSQDYLEMVMAHFKDENDYISAAGTYLHPATEEKLRQMCETAFLGEREQGNWE